MRYFSGGHTAHQWHGLEGITMLKKIIYEMERPDFQEKNANEVTVKIHGYLFSILSPNIADVLHDDSRPKSYSLQYIKRNSEKTDYLIVNTLDPYAEEIPKTLERIGFIQVEGARNECIISKRGEYAADISEIAAPRNLEAIQLKFLTPATHRDGKYVNWMNLDKLLRTVLTKLEEFEGEKITFRQPLMEQMKFTDYFLRSARYHIGGVVPGVIGHMEISPFEKKGSGELKKLYRVLRYSEYAGIGAKTALGMGAVRISAKTEDIGC